MAIRLLSGRVFNGHSFALTQELKVSRRNSFYESDVAALATGRQFAPLDMNTTRTIRRAIEALIVA
jgi:hypothetical protein